MEITSLAVPVVQAPMAGGPSTPELAATVSEAGGLGFLAAGYKAPDQVDAEITEVRARTKAPFGLNIFAPPVERASPEAVDSYARRLAAEATHRNVELGSPRHDDDSWDDKIALAIKAEVPVVSFTFGLPTRRVIDTLHAAGSTVVVTVTRVAEAVQAAQYGVDALVVQGVEAGGHRGGFVDDGADDIGLLTLVRLVAAATDLPLIAAGGVMDGTGLASVLVAGACAAQLGTAFLRCPEAGTSAPHRAALAGAAPTVLTRAFSGRTARGIANRFHAEHAHAAPAAYPDVHHLTAPLRAAARADGDADSLNLWAGQGYQLGTERTATDIVTDISTSARAILRDRCEHRS